MSPTVPTPIRLLPSDLPTFGPDSVAYRLETPYKDAEYAVRIRGTDTYYAGYVSGKSVFHRMDTKFPEGLFTHEPAPVAASAPVVKRLVPTDFKTYGGYAVYRCEPPARTKSGNGRTAEYVGHYPGAEHPWSRVTGVYLGVILSEGVDEPDLTGYDLSAANGSVVR